MEVIAKRKIGIGLILGFIGSGALFFLWISVTIIFFRSMFSTHPGPPYFIIFIGILVVIVGVICLVFLIVCFAPCVIFFVLIVARLKYPKNMIVLDGDTLIINKKIKKAARELFAAEYQKNELILYFVNGRIKLKYVADEQKAYQRLIELIKQTKEQNNG